MKEILIGIIPSIVIILLLGYCIKFIFNRIQYFNKKKRLKQFLILITTLGVYVLFGFIMISYIIRTPNLNFDKKLWIEKEEVRYKMLDNLLNEEILIGKSYDEVELIIGYPDTISDDKWLYNIIGRTWADYHFIQLEIEFNDGKATKNSIIKE